MFLWHSIVQRLFLDRMWKNALHNVFKEAIPTLVNKFHWKQYDTKNFPYFSVQSIASLTLYDFLETPNWGMSYYTCSSIWMKAKSEIWHDFNFYIYTRAARRRVLLRRVVNVHIKDGFVSMSMVSKWKNSSLICWKCHRRTSRKVKRPPKRKFPTPKEHLRPRLILRKRLPLKMLPTPTVPKPILQKKPQKRLLRKRKILCHCNRY